MAALSPSAADHLKSVADFYDRAPPSLNWASRAYREALGHYYNLLIPPGASVIEIGCGAGDLLALLQGRRRVGVDLSANQIEHAQRRLPEATFYVQSGEELSLEEPFDYIILSDTINFAADVQALLARLQRLSHEKTRLILNFHNTLWRPIFGAGTWARIKARQPQSNWLSRSDVYTLLDLENWEVIKSSSRILLPVKCFGLDAFVNRYVAPLVPFLCLTIFCIARPRPAARSSSLTASIVIPARNEAGNIENAVRRTPALGSHTQLIFVEGHSHDGTWEEIKRVANAFTGKNIVCLQQSGTGKGNAVREGFAAATGDVLMILDADLTVAPEELTKFYDVIANGHAEFANGIRLIYPMEQEAMRFLNLCANYFFSVLFSWLLGQSIKDTLCGTKALLRADYERLAANRSYFGEFDPFGDFDLLFGADKLNLKIADVAIRYCERTYGTTNIARWRHGWLLLRMMVIAAKRLKFV